MRKSSTFLDRVGAHTEHIIIKNYNNFDNYNNKKIIINLKKKERQRKKERIKTINIIWGIKGFNKKIKIAKSKECAFKVGVNIC